MPFWWKRGQKPLFLVKNGSFLVKMGHFGVFGTKVRYHPWRVISNTRFPWEMLISDPWVSFWPLGGHLELVDFGGTTQKRHRSYMLNSYDGVTSKCHFWQNDEKWVISTASHKSLPYSSVTTFWGFSGFDPSRHSVCSRLFWDFGHFWPKWPKSRPERVI